MISGYFVWWYGEGLVQAYKNATAILAHVTDFFSLPILIRTLFAPWKDDVVGGRNLSLSDQLEVIEMNFIGRFVGFIIRSVVILVTLIILLVLLTTAAVGLVAWVITPFLIIILPAIGVGKLFI